MQCDTSRDILVYLMYAFDCDVRDMHYDKENDVDNCVSRQA